MFNNKILIEYEHNDSIIQVIKESSLKPRYSFVFTSKNTRITTTHSTYRTVGGAIRKFNKAVNALKNGTKIK